LYYELIARAKVDKEFLEMAMRKLFPVKKLYNGDEKVASN
jgi:hypothetical protein